MGGVGLRQEDCELKANLSYTDPSQNTKTNRVSMEVHAFNPNILRHSESQASQSYKAQPCFKNKHRRWKEGGREGGRNCLSSTSVRASLAFLKSQVCKFPNQRRDCRVLPIAGTSSQRARQEWGHSWAPTTL